MIGNLQRLIDFSRKHKFIIAYGAGEYGYLVNLFLKINQIDIAAFMVSVPRQGDELFMGKPVYENKKFPYNKEDCGVILSLSEKHHVEVQKILGGLKFPHIYAENNIMEAVAQYLRNNPSTNRKIMEDKQIWTNNAYKHMVEIIEHRPLDLNIETINFCPLKCRFCCNRMIERTRNVMSLELFKHICNQWYNLDGGRWG